MDLLDVHYVRSHLVDTTVLFRYLVQPLLILDPNQTLPLARRLLSALPCLNLCREENVNGMSARRLTGLLTIQLRAPSGSAPPELPTRSHRRFVPGVHALTQVRDSKALQG